MKVNFLAKLSAVLLVVCALYSARAAMSTIDGITWTYTVTNGCAMLGDGKSSAISTNTIGSITIPSRIGRYDVTSIGDSAFAYCRTLESVTIPNSVTSIGCEAFRSCSSLKSVTIPNSVTSIGDMAFAACKSLESVTIPNSVTSIGDGAFIACSLLESVIIPNSVTNIRGRTFMSCSSLKSVTIPNSVTSIGDTAFSGCASLESVTIPNSVTSIGSSAFKSCISFKSVTIPNSVTSIGSSAFMNCRSCKSVTIPNSVMRIGGDVFGYCSLLESITFLGNAPAEIGSYAFERVASNCTAYVTRDSTGWGVEIPGTWNGINIDYIKDSYNPILDFEWSVANDEVRITQYIGTNTVVVIPPTINGYPVVGIGDYAFADCFSLTSVTIPSSVKSIGDWAFYSCYSLESVVIPDSVTSIGDSAFSSCDSLKTIMLPNSLQCIEKFAFYGCESLLDISIPEGVRSISEATFFRCHSLTSVVIPNSVTNIENDAFCYCGMLTNVVISGSVKSIGDGVFSMSPITSITFLGDAPVLGGFVFDSVAADCTAYVKRGSTGWGVDIPGTWNGINIDYIKDSYNPISDFEWSVANDEVRITQYIGTNTVVVIPPTINGYPVVGIGDYAFCGCFSLESVTIPNSVKSIGNDAFSDCSSLESVIIADSVISIGDFAFSNCSSLMSITIPDGVTSIGAYAFSECASYIYDKTTPGIVLVDGWVVEYEDTLSGSLNLNSKIRGIADLAFYDCSTLTSINIPDSIKSIGDSAFSGCSSLTSVTIGDSVTSIGEAAFSDCSSLKSIKIPNGVTNIGESMFGGCSSLTSVTIPNSVTSIGYAAFAGCGSLASVGIPDSVMSIGGYAFENCSSLMSVTIPDSVTSIGGEAFYGCSSLTSITIPDSVMSVGAGAFSDCNLSLYDKKTFPGLVLVDGWIVGYDDTLSRDLKLTSKIRGVVSHAFMGCRSLDSLMIEEGVTRLFGDYAFYGCSLTSVAIPNSVTNIGKCVFSGCKLLTSFKVAEENACYSSKNDLLLSKDGRILLSGVNGNVIVPSDVASIGEYAFYGCSSLTSVRISNSVTSIGDYAFYGCDGLTSIIIPDSVMSIGDDAFSWCGSLASVTIGDGVRIIGSEAFDSCYSLTNITIGNSVTSIGEWAFDECWSLRSVTIPSSVRYIGEAAFARCESLESIIFQGDAPVLMDVHTPFGCTAYVRRDSTGWGVEIPGTWKGINIAYIDDMMPTTYTVTFDLGAYGTRTGGGELIQSVVDGECAVAPTVQATLGWRFVGWTPDVASVILSNTTFFAQYEEDVTTYHLEIVQPARGGSITGANNGPQPVDSMLMLTRKADTGYHIVGWTGDIDGLYQWGDSLAVVMDMPRKIGLAVEPDVYSITYADTRGALNTNPATYTIEDEVVFAPLPDVEGWKFVGWSQKSIPVGSIGDVTITAQWMPAECSITIGGEESKITWGSEVTFRAPEPWYDETCTTQIVYLGTTFTVPVVTNEFTVTVTNDIDFTWDILATNYWFEATEAQNGTIDAPENGWKPYGDTFVISAIPDEHCHFVSWLGDTQGCSETNITDLVVTMDQVRKIAAEFAIDTFVVTFDGGLHGTLLGKKEQMIAYGAKAVEPSVIPDAGYIFTGWNGDVTVPIVRNTSFVAEYATIPYGISYAELKGAVNPNPVAYTVEDEIVFAPLSNVEGWNFVGWSPKSIAKGSTGPITVTAQWERVIHSVNVGGASTNVVYGSEMTFRAPEPWCDETCTTQIVYVGTTFTAPVVTNEFTVVVTNDIDFTWDILATNYWLEVEATELGSITGAMSGWQSAGEVVELAAVPEVGCRLYRWMGDIEGCVATNEFLFVEMNRTRAIGARFAYDIRAVIDSISPQNPTEESSLILQGHGEGGTVAEHLWTVVRLSDGKVSELARTANCRIKLNAGEWRVEYRVKDITGIWSDPASQTITVAAVMPVVDLQIARTGVKFYDSIGLPTSNIETGDVVTVKVTVQNRGNANMSGRATLYLCDGILPVDDMSALKEDDPRVLATARVSRLNLGKSQTVSMTWNVGSSLSGEERFYDEGPNAFTVVVVSDADAEAVVNNNLVTTMLELGESDIELSEIFNLSADYETSIFVGSDYSVSGRVWYERDGARVYVAGATLTFMIDGEIAGSGVADSSGRYLWMFTAPDKGSHTISVKAVDGTIVKTYAGTFTSVERAEPDADGQPGAGGGSGGEEENPEDPEEPVPSVKKANLKVQTFVCESDGITGMNGNAYSVALGGEVTLDAVVKNVGQMAVTNAFSVKITDITNDDVLGYLVVTNGLTVGEELNVSIDEPFVLDKAGRYGYRVIVDEAGLVDESSETDNEGKVWITVEEPLPNLVVTDMTLSNTQPVEGDELIIRAMVRNIGSASSPAGVRVYLDANGIRYEIKLSDELAAGESADVTYSVFPVSGSLRILIEADYFDEVAESVETDNSLSRTITVYSANADVAPVSLTADPYPSAGEPCVLTAVFKNNGGASYQGGTAVFFENDPVSGTIAESMVGPISWKGGTGMATCVWTPVGNKDRTVGVILDGKMYKTVFSAMPPPDLRVAMEDISFEPGTPSSGDNVKFRAMIRNVSGSVASTNATVVFDVAPVDGDFAHLTTMTVSHLAPGGSVAVDADIPYTVLRGIYKVKVSVMDESGRDVRSSDNIAERIFGVDVPVAVTGGDIVCVAGDTVTLDGSDSIDATQWRWSLIEAPNGNTASISDASVAVTTFTPQIAGLYKFSLVVSDGLNESTPAECTVLVDRVRITASATKGGSISPSGEIVYPAGATPEYVGIESRGYSFDSFKLDGVSVTNKPSTYMFTALDRNHIIEACFSAVDYSITYNELKGAENTNPATYTIENEIVFAPLSNVEGWNFVGWSPKTIAKGSTGAITVTAQWERVIHSVNVGGASTNVVYGSEMTFRAPEPWYDETCTTQIVYLGTTFTAPVVTNEFTVTVTNDIDFTWDILATNYWFEVVEVQNGTIDAPENGWKPHGDSFVISAIPDEHYHFVSWLGDTHGCVETNITDLVVTMDQARKISATFAIDTFIVTFDSGVHGVLFGETTQTLAYGEIAVVPSVIPDTGYSFIGWSGDVTAPVVNDVTFIAEYATIPYDISYSELKGAENPNPVAYTVEDEVVFAPLSDVEGWNFVGWSPKSIAKGSTGSITVTAQWERVIHSVTVGGASTNVVYGSEMTFRAPEPWYDETCTTQIVYLGTMFTAPVVTNEFTITVTNDIDFTWDILATNYWLKVNASEGGSVDFDSAWMSAGSRKSISATPDFSYRFVRWEGDVSNSQSTSPDIVILMNQARSLKAVFEKIPLTIGEAANAPEYDWYIEGDAVWFGEWSKAASDGVHAVRSGAIGDSKETVLGLRLEGAGTLSFDWRASCEERYDAVRLEVDGKQIRVLWGETSWTNVCINLDIGEHNIRWVYMKGRSGALGDDAVWVDNVVWESATEPTLAEALGEFEWETEGDINWVGMRSEYAYEGTSFAIAEGLGDLEASIIRTRVSGAGTIKFRWAVSCEELYDWLDFIVDGEVVEMTTGETEWMEVSVELGEGDHVLEWMYWKDEMDDPDLVGANCAMLDYVRWYPLGETPPEISDKTLAAFFAWLKANNQISQNATKEDAVRVFSSGATAAGKSVTLYSEFVAGTNPADVMSEFKAMIEIDENDQPIVTPSPNLGSSRKYVVFGKKNIEDLTETWKEVEKGKEKDYNFFKITVDLAE